MSGAGLDGGVFFGRDETTGREADLPRLLSLLDACGVERALAAAYRAIWFDDRDAFREVDRDRPPTIPRAEGNISER